ncbi:Eukaryotic translation initiation factor 3 subunit J [Yarrowia sp. C11]|nr:Eukaryotic translation initiation factor 3 subunit J [Yarrowia sp. E02]KAG5371343.1 Eukaryotic translation initiation factor 3 subunit J [Yarrowia sp. C11]
MASWDDEDFEVPAAATPAVPANWDDEEEEDVMDSWDAEETPKAPGPKTTVAAPKKAQRQQIAKVEREMAAMKLKPEDASTKRDRQRQAELDSDMMNASELFGNSGGIADNIAKTEVAPAPAAPMKLSDLAIFHPKDKKDFTNLKETLAPILTDLNKTSPLAYPDFAITFTKAMAEPLKVEQLRKLISTLNAYQNEKIREEKAARGKKKKPGLAAASAKINDDKDTTTFNDNFDDFDDFM